MLTLRDILTALAAGFLAASVAFAAQNVLGTAPAAHTAQHQVTKTAG